jgi:hypothetical protein
MPCSAANETDGYRFGTTYEGITPYGAVHAQSFRAPDFSEVDGNNGGFALICSSNKQIPSRAFVSHCISSKPFPMMAMVGDSGSQVNALPCAHLWPHHCPTICHAGPRWHRRIGARFWRTQTTATLARAQQKRAQSAPPDPTPERRLRSVHPKTASRICKRAGYCVIRGSNRPKLRCSFTDELGQCPRG